MTKNSKYANLPNIAIGESDVYETSGQPEQQEQQAEKKLANLSASKFIKQEFNQSFLDQVESPNDNIDVIDFKPKDAFTKFKGMYDFEI